MGPLIYTSGDEQVPSQTATDQLDPEEHLSSEAGLRGPSVPQKGDKPRQENGAAGWWCQVESLPQDVLRDVI